MYLKWRILGWWWVQKSGRCKETLLHAEYVKPTMISKKKLTSQTAPTHFVITAVRLTHFTKFRDLKKLYALKMSAISLWTWKVIFSQIFRLRRNQKPEKWWLSTAPWKIRIWDYAPTINAIMEWLILKLKSWWLLAKHVQSSFAKNACSLCMRENAKKTKWNSFKRIWDIDSV